MRANKKGKVLIKYWKRFLREFYEKGRQGKS
jgi:hypothetical protein